MDKSKEINYDHVSIFSGERHLSHKKNWREEYGKGRVDFGFRGLDLVIDDKYVLEMRDINIPLSARGNIQSKEDIIESAKRLIGDFGDNLEKYEKLADKNIVQDDLYFTPDFFYDYSQGEGNGIGYQKLGKTVLEARAIEFDSEYFSSKDIEIGKKPEIEYKPTFQAIRDLDFIKKITKDVYGITGETFADRLNNFLVMYDSVAAHTKFIKDEELRLWLEAKKKGKKPRQQKQVFVGKLVWE
jgi:hypothetical protein